jgi:hypothetical protein
MIETVDSFEKCDNIHLMAWRRVSEYPQLKQSQISAIVVFHFPILKSVDALFCAGQGAPTGVSSVQRFKRRARLYLDIPSRCSSWESNPEARVHNLIS